MNQKNTTKTAEMKNTTDKNTSKTPETKASTGKSLDVPATAYTTFRGVLTSKSRKTLPRGTRANVSGDKIVFTAKGVTIASVPLRDFANGELKRHGFQLSA